jgi:membrane fusion protein YbhG
MRRLIIIPLVVLLGIFVWLVLRGAREPDGFYTGSIEARDVRLGSLVGGRIAEVKVAEGDSVRAGDVIVRFQSDLLDPQVREQEARVAQAKAAMDRVMTGPRREQVERARVEWERAQKELQRQESLMRQKVTSQQALEAATAAAASARQSYEELKRGSRSEDEREAMAAYSAAEAQLAFLKSQQDELVVRAPAAGTIQTLDLRPGDIVPANQPVATMLMRGDLWVHVYVPETKLGAVHVGQSAQLAIDTYPKRTFPARVISIRDRAEYTPRNVQTTKQREDQVFAVKLEVAPAPELKPGMTATVRFE